MMKGSLLRAFAAVGFCSLATCASATITTVIYTGTVTLDEEENLFGFGNGFSRGVDEYVGDSVTITVMENLALGSKQSEPGGLVEVSGGSSVSLPSPILNATLAVSGGPSFSVSGSAAYNSAQVNGAGYSQSDIQSLNSNLPQYFYQMEILAQSSSSPFGNSFTGIIDNYTESLGSESPEFLIEGSLNSLSTPEPATWTMMIIGFAGLGFAGRRLAKGAQTARLVD
jgi:hypothetical protein